VTQTIPTYTRVVEELCCQKESALEEGDGVANEEEPLACESDALLQAPIQQGLRTN
jgi:hypothetical protein